MSIHINEVLDYLDSHPICCHNGSVQSLMEMLHEAYTLHNVIDSGEIHDAFRELRTVLDKLSQEDADRLYGVACDLCLEHEQLAFSHGIVVGMHLMSEVKTLP